MEGHFTFKNIFAKLVMNLEDFSTVKEAKKIDAFVFSVVEALINADILDNSRSSDFYNYIVNIPANTRLFQTSMNRVVYRQFDEYGVSTFMGMVKEVVMTSQDSASIKTFENYDNMEQLEKHAVNLKFYSQLKQIVSEKMTEMDKCVSRSFYSRVLKAFEITATSHCNKHYALWTKKMNSDKTSELLQRLAGDDRSSDLMRTTVLDLLDLFQSIDEEMFP